MAGDLTYFGIVLAGLLSFLSPCVLPLVPPYLTYLAGVSLDEVTHGDLAIDGSGGATRISGELRQRILTNAVVFVAGFTVVFVALGAGASSIGLLVRQYQDVLAVIAGLVIIAMGLHFLGFLRIGLLFREARFQTGGQAATLGGSFLMGLAFAFGWTPCIGPVLGAVLGFASSSETVGQGAFLLFLYSAGLGIPFILAAFFAKPFMEFLSRFRRHLGTVEKVMGLLLVATGILFLTGGMQWMAYTLLETFPALQQLG